MGKRDSDIIGERPCKCGCGEMVKLKRWTLNPSKTKTEYIRGHQQYNNKRGWKGGAIKQQGYILLSMPNHPYRNVMGSGYVKRSRLVMEEHLGRYLERTEIVHHINGVRDDDRLENLVITNNSTHLSLHHKGKIVSRDTNGKFLKGGDAHA
jgi:hypothetical protein